MNLQYLNQSLDGRRRRTEGRVIGGLFQHLKRFQIFEIFLVRILSFTQLLDKRKLNRIVNAAVVVSPVLQNFVPKFSNCS